VLVSEIYLPQSLEEALDTLKRYPEALVYGGGTDILRKQAETFIHFPREVLSIASLPELRQVLLTERFVEIGAAVRLSEILELKENAVPELLAQAIRGISTPTVRNLATIGGNLASRERFMDSWPALACLDALVEMHDAEGARWVNVNRLVDEGGHPALPGASIISRVRIPLERWDVTALRKVGPRDCPAPETAVFACAAKADKGILSEFRLAFAGELALRPKDIESRLVGRRLPLDAKDRASFGAEYRLSARDLPQGLRIQFGTLVDGALDLLAR